jgi:FAD/FMN-containing dehydrogenase
MSSKVIRNWDGTQSWKPEEIHCPESEEQIAGLIRRAAEDRKRVKAVGGALSWSDIISILAGG